MDEKIYKIENLDHYGRGISKNDGKITFIENALIDELVEIKVQKDKKKYTEAIATKIIQKNKNRQKVECPYYFACGGCNLLHMNYVEQVNFKTNKIKDIFSKYIGDSIKINNLIESEPIYYRNKATFQVKEKVGYYQKKSYEIIQVDHCLLVHPKINELLKLMQENNSLYGIEQIMIRVGINTKEVMVVVKGNNQINKEKINQVLKNKVDVLAFYIDNQYQYFTEKKYIIERIGSYSFMISPASFFQVNTKQTEKLYNQVLKYIDSNDNVLDLYCGTGTIGIYISSIAKKVIGVEINDSAVIDANQNKKLNHISNIEFLCQSVSKLKMKYEDINTIIVDPPRAGLDNNSLNYIMDYHANKIIYVSCDPMTLVRDLNVLKKNYNIKEVTPVDMFPNTYHVECVCLLERR